MTARGTRTREALRRRFRRIVALPLASGLLGALIACLYGYFTLPLDEVDELWIALAALLGGASGLVLYTAEAYRRLGTFRRLGDRAAADPDAATLRRAVVDLLAFPDRAFVLAELGWLTSVVLSMLALWAWAPGAGWGPVGRLALAALWCSPMSSLLTHLVATLECRRGVEEASALGLDARAVVDSVPPRRSQLRLRLVVFTAICVITPAAISADLAFSGSRAVLLRVGQEQRADAKRALAARLTTEVYQEHGITLSLTVLLALVTAFTAGVVVSRPMREIANEATRIASGKLGAPRAIPADDEVWAVSAAFTAIQLHLGRLLAELKGAGTKIAVATDDIVNTSTRYEDGATEQATALNETSATTEELARSARQIADNAQAVEEIAQKTLAAAKRGQEGADEFSGAMGRMERENHSISTAVVKLNKRVQQIGRIVEFINGVADKSDLLALNAELEGTKAGEVGRGFALVAAEMRRLAENVLESTKEIESLIEEIREATHAAVAATSAGMQATETGGALAREVMQSLGEILQLAGRTSEAVKSISLATQQQQTGTDQLAEAMADILRVTQLSLAATKQVSAANVDLAGLSQDLKSVVGRFRLGEGA